MAGACDDLVAALVGCGVIPEVAQAHDTGRFQLNCTIQTSLPGSTTTASTIEACARSLNGNCDAECQSPRVGTLLAGAPCNVSYQCQSGSCAPVALRDGGYSECGACTTTIPLGQPCGTSSTGACAVGAYCQQGVAQSSCAEYATVGAACSAEVLCQSMLFCSPTQRCAQRGSVAAACSADGDCSTGLACRAGACAQLGPVGASCAGSDAPCAQGLICDDATSTCVSPTYVKPGDSCAAPGQACVYGSCSGAGFCPAIVPDGQPCPVDGTQTCDVWAQCDTDGQCAIPGSTVCR